MWPKSISDMCYQSDFLFGVSYKAERYQDQQSPKSTTNSWTDCRELAAVGFLSESAGAASHRTQLFVFVAGIVRKGGRLEGCWRGFYVMCRQIETLSLERLQMTSSSLAFSLDPGPIFALTFLSLTLPRHNWCDPGVWRYQIRKRLLPMLTAGKSFQSSHYLAKTIKAIYSW